MKKWFSVLAAALVGAALVTGCSASEDVPETVLEEFLDMMAMDDSPRGDAIWALWNDIEDVKVKKEIRLYFGFFDQGVVFQSPDETQQTLIKCEALDSVAKALEDCKHRRGDYPYEEVIQVFKELSDSLTLEAHDDDAYFAGRIGYFLLLKRFAQQALAICPDLDGFGDVIQDKGLGMEEFVLSEDDYDTYARIVFYRDNPKLQVGLMERHPIE